MISETNTPSEEYENFILTQIKIAAECMPNKQRAKYRVPREILAFRKK